MAARTRKTHLFGNANGLPGLPQTSYVAVRPGAEGHPLQQSNRQPANSSILPPPPLFPDRGGLGAGGGLDSGMTRRLELVEQRLMTAEKNQRNLLDEFMATQQEVKISVKRTENAVLEDKENMSKIDMVMRQSHGKLFDVEERLSQCEQRIKEHRTALQEMGGYNRSIENVLQSAQRDGNDKYQKVEQKLQEFKMEMSRALQGNGNAERLCSILKDENQEIANKIENIQAELSSLNNNMKFQGKLMEETKKRQGRGLSSNVVGPTITTNDKYELDSRMLELNAALHDLTDRVNEESKLRVGVEENVNKRIQTVAQEQASAHAKKDKELQDFHEKVNNLQPGLNETEREQLKLEIASASNQLSHRIDESVLKVRNDTVEKLKVIEASLKQENERRLAKEVELDGKVNGQMKELKEYSEEESVALQKIFEQHTAQTRERLSELNVLVKNVEVKVKDTKLEAEKVMHAEITQRQNENKRLEAKIDDLDAKMCNSAFMLHSSGNDDDEDNEQNVVSGMTKEEIEEMQRANEDGIREHFSKEIADVNTRLSDVEMKVHQQEERLDQKLQSSMAEDLEQSQIMGDKMQQKIDGVIFTQDRLKKKVDDLEDKIEDMPKNFTALQQRITKTQDDASKMIDAERKEREEDMEEVKKVLETIQGNDEPNDVSTVSNLSRVRQELDQNQIGMRKLSEALHVVKSSLSDKIKAEGVTRSQKLKLIEEDITALKAKVR